MEPVEIVLRLNSNKIVKKSEEMQEVQVRRWRSSQFMLNVTALDRDFKLICTGLVLEKCADR